MAAYTSAIDSVSVAGDLLLVGLFILLVSLACTVFTATCIFRSEGSDHVDIDVEKCLPLESNQCDDDPPPPPYATQHPTPLQSAHPTFGQNYNTVLDVTSPTILYTTEQRRVQSDLPPTYDELMVFCPTRFQCPYECTHK